jgi:hypothetical protein
MRAGLVAVLFAAGASLGACECGSLVDARNTFCSLRPEVCDGSMGTGGDSGLPGEDASVDAGLALDAASADASPGDAGSFADAASGPDAGSANDGGADSGPFADAGWPSDSGPPDAGPMIDAGPGSVTGTVTNFNTGGAIGGATVALVDDAGTTITATTADSNGNYNLPGIPAGTQTITGDATGYLLRIYSVNIQSGLPTTQDIQLSTSGKLQGNVVDSANSSPIMGAQVQIQGGNLAYNQTVTTDSNGHYTPGYIPIGMYTVTCAAVGFTTQMKNTTINTGATTNLDFSL